MTDNIKAKHREKIMKEFRGKDYEKMTESLLEMMGEVTDDAKLELGWSLLDHREYRAGLALFRTLPWNTCGEAKFNGMGRALTEMGRYHEAKNLLQNGLQRYPQSCSLWVAMGGLSDALGNHSESLKCFEIALQFASEKDYKSVCYNQAVALMKLGCFSDAASIIEYLIDEIPEDPKYVAERGYCALEMGYPEEALCYYEKAMELFKKSPTVEVGVCVYTGLCSSYLELDMKKEAVEIALEGLNKFADADPMLFHNAGAAFVNMGWYKEAKEVLQKGVEKFPGDEELKKFLNDVEEDDNPPEEGDILGLVLVVTAVLAHRKFGKRK